MSKKTIIWDFDGTLALHRGLWSGSMIAALDALVKGHKINIEHLKPYLQTGFPWHEPEKSHPELSLPGAWWGKMEKHFMTIFREFGFDEDTSCALAKKTHDIYVDEKRYEVFPNTIKTLNKLKIDGWRNVILSNHVPELSQIVDKLGFSSVIDECFTSALIGYEKPNIKAFQYVLDYLHHPDCCIMVGDSVTADIHGAESAGITAILLYTIPLDTTYNYCTTIDEVENTINNIMSHKSRA